MYENCICINFVKRWVFFFVVQDILVVISNQQKEKKIVISYIILVNVDVIKDKKSFLL